MQVPGVVARPVVTAAPDSVEQSRVLAGKLTLVVLLSVFDQTALALERRLASLPLDPYGDLDLAWA
ncbi:MAG: hypothetical protein ACJ796_09915 [Gemmatimonadaceae bacterium]